MRPLLPICVLCVALTAASASAEPPVVQSASVPGEAVFVVLGRGYGHGVGMSQYGAYGMANAGYTYDRILAHYYVGTQLGRTPSRDVRVLLAEGEHAVTISSRAPFTVVDATGATARMPAGPLVLKPDLVVAAPAGPLPAVGPILVRPGPAPLSLDGRPYRGRLEISLQSAYLQVVNVVALESYVQGVVAGEMPSTWPLDALEAQAVAARSYALASLIPGKTFDLYPDARSQVYPGIAGEKPRATQAATSTAGQVVLYGGKVARTFYFSSSGGRTASAEDVFGVSIPYLVSQPDPWDTASPYYRWGPILVGARTLQAKLGVEGRVVDAAGVATQSGWLRSITIQTLTGPTTVPANLLRTAFGLRSTAITIGVLRLDRPSGPALYGSPLRLTGIARGLTSSRLSSSLDGVTWTSAAVLARGSTGGVSALVKPSQTIRYRLQATEAASPAQLVRVSPRVQLAPPLSPGVLSGTVRPRLVGADVTIERKTGTVWTEVARAVVDGTGAFSAVLDLLPGSYRARVAPSGGFTEGVAPAVTVSG